MKYDQFWVYVLTNRSGTLYIGVTNNLERRVAQHKAGEISGFARKYRLETLIYFEEFQSIREALDREKQLKKSRREKKLNLIAQSNPQWLDLSVSPESAPIHDLS